MPKHKDTKAGRALWDRIEDRRKELEDRFGRAEFSRKAVSEKMGLGHTYYSGGHAKGTVPSATNVRKLSEILNVTEAYIYGDHPSGPRAEIEALVDSKHPDELPRILSILRSVYPD